MQYKLPLLWLFILPIVVLAGCGTPSSSDENTPNQDVALEQQDTLTGVETVTGTTAPIDANNNELSDSKYTFDQVKEHNTVDSCWAMINNNVYDLTTWVAQHPWGSDQIAQLCGTDGSDKFNNQHSGWAMQEKALESFMIGSLIQ